MWLSIKLSSLKQEQNGWNFYQSFKSVKIEYPKDWFKAPSNDYFFPNNIFE